MNLLKKVVTYQDEQITLINNNKNEIEHSSKKLLLIVIILGSLAFVPFIFISLVVESFKPLFLPYVIELSILTIYLIIFHKVKCHVSSVILIYTASVLLIGYALYTSVFIYPNQLCVVILFILFQIPIITIDKSWRVNLLVLLYASVYIIFVILFKNPVLIADEILNCLLFSIFGIILGELLRYAQLENFELKRQAVMRVERDYMTGLYSKGAFERLTEETLTRDAGSNRVHALLGFDIDDFKNINDKYGHAFGDIIIREFSEEIQMLFRESDLVGRVGGDEFAALMLDYESILLLNEKMGRFCSNITKKNFGLKNGECISCSVGVSLFPKHGATYNDLFEKVDEALYYAKAHGKSTFHIFGVSKETDTSFRIDGRDLKNVLENTTDGIAKYAYVDSLKLLYFNKKLSDLTGGVTGALFTPDFDPFAYVHPEDLEKLRTAMQTLKEAFYEIHSN